jgi:hypothetical protein
MGIFAQPNGKCFIKVQLWDYSNRLVLKGKFKRKLKFLPEIKKYCLGEK